MTAQSTPPLTPEAARGLQNLLRARIGPGLSEREPDAVEDRFGFSFSADHRVFLAAGLPHGSRRRPDWRNGDPEDLAARLSQPLKGVFQRYDGDQRRCRATRNHAQACAACT